MGIPAIGAVDKSEISIGSLYKIDGSNGRLELLDSNYIDIKKSKKNLSNLKQTKKTKLFLDIINQYNSDDGKIIN